MALNPIAFTEKVVRNFIRYQLTAYPFADETLLAQMRQLLSLDQTMEARFIVIDEYRGMHGVGG